MKIAMVAFPLEFVGGAKTMFYNVKQGFEDVGHQVGTYYITTNTTRKPEPGKNEYGIQNILGFEKPEWLRETSDTLNSYDYLLYIGGCPHLLKNYQKEGWKKLYDVVDTSKVIVAIIDSYIRKYYPWLIDILENKRVKVYTHHDRLEKSVEFLKTMKKRLPYAFVMKPDMGVYHDQKKELIVDTCNFKGCKHKHLLFEYPQLHKFEIVQFGDTNNPSYYVFEQALKLYNLNMSILGFKPFFEIAETLKVAKYGLDLSKFGEFFINLDNVMLEYCAYGAVPVTILPVGNEPLGVLQLTSIADLGKLEDEAWRRQTAESNYEALKTHYDYRNVAKGLIDFWQEPFVSDESGFW